METIKLTPAELELIQLKREQEVIQQKEKEIADKIRYEKDVLYAKESLMRLKNENEENNTLIKKLYDTLIDEGVGMYITLLNRKNSLAIYSHLNEKLKPEDKISPIEVDQHFIKILEYGTIYSCDSELKTQLPFPLSSRYQSYKPKTIALKIKEKIQQDKVEKENEIKKSSVTETLKKMFLEIDNKATFENSEYRTQTRRNKYEYRGGLKVTYSNGS